MLKILMVEDSEVAQKAQETILAEVDCTVDVAEDGEKAINLIKRYKYDAALIDLNLPGIHGTEVIKFLRANSKTTKIIAISAYIDETVEKTCYDAGSDIVFKKPITAEDLRIFLYRI